MRVRRNHIHEARPIWHADTDHQRMSDLIVGHALQDVGQFFLQFGKIKVAMGIYIHKRMVSKNCYWQARTARCKAVCKNNLGLRGWLATARCWASQRFISSKLLMDARTPAACTGLASAGKYRAGSLLA